MGILSMSRVMNDAEWKASNCILVLSDGNTFIVQIRCSYRAFYTRVQSDCLKSWKFRLAHIFVPLWPKMRVFLGTKLSTTCLVICVCVECGDQSIIWWRVLFKFTHASCDSSNERKISFKTILSACFCFEKFFKNWNFIRLCRCFSYLYHILRLR